MTPRASGFNARGLAAEALVYFLVIPDANTRIAKTTMKTAITSRMSRVIVI